MFWHDNLNNLLVSFVLETSTIALTQLWDLEVTRGQRKRGESRSTVIHAANVRSDFG